MIGVPLHLAGYLARKLEYGTQHGVICAFTGFTNATFGGCKNSYIYIYIYIYYVKIPFLINVSHIFFIQGLSSLFTMTTNAIMRYRIFVRLEQTYNQHQRTYLNSRYVQLSWVLALLISIPPWIIGHYKEDVSLIT